MNLTVLSTGEPTDHLTTKTPDILDFGIIKGIPKNYTPNPELSSDYSPIIFTVNSKIMIKSKFCIFCNAKTKWPYFQELLKNRLYNSIPLKINDDIIYAVENFDYAVQGRLECNAV